MSNFKLKLGRLALLESSPALELDGSETLQLGGVEVHIEHTYERESGRVHLAVATTECEKPQLDDSGAILVPDEPRKRSEQAIDLFADLLTVGQNARQTLSSPTPCIVLHPENEETREWLDSTAGLRLRHPCFARGRFRVDLEKMAEASADRQDGLQLMREVLATSHPTSVLRENRAPLRVWVRESEQGLGAAARRVS